MTSQSVAAESYHPLAMAETVLAQACAFARLMGLHQEQAVNACSDQAEALERYKLARVLYIRDKKMAVLRGSSCWFPDDDTSLHDPTGAQQPGSQGLSTQLELAHIQAEVIRVCCPSVSSKRRHLMTQTSLIQLERELTQWAHSRDVFDPQTLGDHNSCVQMEFLGTRIQAREKVEHLSHQTLDDARVCCMLLLLARGKDDKGLLKQRLRSANVVNTLYRSSDNANEMGKSIDDDPTSEGTHQKARKTPNTPNIATASSNADAALGSFPMHAFMVLLRSIILSSTARASHPVDDDMQLLRQVSVAYTEANHHSSFNNHSRKVSRAFERLIKIMDKACGGTFTAVGTSLSSDADDPKQYCEQDVSNANDTIDDNNTEHSDVNHTTDYAGYESHKVNDMPIGNYQSQYAGNTIPGPYYNPIEVSEFADLVPPVTPFSISTTRDDFGFTRAAHRGTGSYSGAATSAQLGMGLGFANAATFDCSLDASPAPRMMPQSEASEPTQIQNSNSGPLMPPRNKRTRGQ